MSRTSRVPDLRHDHNEFTLEHCSILLERLGGALDLIYDEGMTELSSMVDAETMRDDLLSLMNAQQLSTLFDTEMGKGLIVGMFFGRFIVPQETED